MLDESIKMAAVVISFEQSPTTFADIMNMVPQERERGKSELLFPPHQPLGRGEAKKNLGPKQLFAKNYFFLFLPYFFPLRSIREQNFSHFSMIRYISSNCRKVCIVLGSDRYISMNYNITYFFLSFTGSHIFELAFLRIKIEKFKSLFFRLDVIINFFWKTLYSK